MDFRLAVFLGDETVASKYSTEPGSRTSSRGFRSGSAAIEAAIRISTRNLFTCALLSNVWILIPPPLLLSSPAPAQRAGVHNPRRQGRPCALRHRRRAFLLRRARESSEGIQVCPAASFMTRAQAACPYARAAPHPRIPRGSVALGNDIGLAHSSPDRTSVRVFSKSRSFLLKAASRCLRRRRRFQRGLPASRPKAPSASQKAPSSKSISPPFQIINHFGRQESQQEGEQSVH